jgi:hypothetical protein
VCGNLPAASFPLAMLGVWSCHTSTRFMEVRAYGPVVKFIALHAFMNSDYFGAGDARGSPAAHTRTGIHGRRSSVQPAFTCSRLMKYSKPSVCLYLAWQQSQKNLQRYH